MKQSCRNKKEYNFTWNSIWIVQNYWFFQPEFKIEVELVAKKNCCWGP